MTDNWLKGDMPILDIALSPDRKQIVVCRIGDAVPKIEGWTIVPMEMIEALLQRDALAKTEGHLK
jgi:hypothetical protein